jgi:hypothetical protein
MCDTTILRILSALEGVRAPAQPGEYDIHCLIESALSRAGISCAHEYRLAPRCRIDFFVGGVGIEVKKGRPARAALERQLKRYLASGELEALVVVTQRAVSLPDAIGGKSVRLVSLNRLWGVALP